MATLVFRALWSASLLLSWDPALWRTEFQRWTLICLSKRNNFAKLYFVFHWRIIKILISLVRGLGWSVIFLFLSCCYFYCSLTKYLTIYVQLLIWDFVMRFRAVALNSNYTHWKSLHLEMQEKHEQTRLIVNILRRALTAFMYQVFNFIRIVNEIQFYLFNKYIHRSSNIKIKLQVQIDYIRYSCI